MSKANYMYGQEANTSIKANEREPYWDYMARRGAGGSSKEIESFVNKNENIAQDVYPVREDVPADLWGKPVAKDPDKWAYENKIRLDVGASVNKNEALSKDMVNHPSHYNKGIETTKYIKSWDMNWNQANVIKYVSRYNLKNKNDVNLQIQDLMKAKWYLEDLIKELEEHNPY